MERSAVTKGPREGMVTVGGDVVVWRLKLNERTFARVPLTLAKALKSVSGAMQTKRALAWTWTGTRSAQNNFPCQHKNICKVNSIVSDVLLSYCFSSVSIAYCVIHGCGEKIFMLQGKQRYLGPLNS
jgi:hypothetical protein